MSFILKTKKAGSTLEVKNGGGTLKVISGRAKAHSIKAMKDDGSIKKGDTIEGIEFALTLSDTGNFEPQKYQQPSGDEKYGKWVPDLTPIIFPLTCTLFVSGQCGLAYLALFNNCEKLGLPEGLIDGFAGQLNIGETIYTKQLVEGDFTTKIPSLLLMMFDDCEKVECKAEFSVPYAGNNIGKSGGQSEADKLTDRMKFVEALMTDSTPEQQAYIKFVAANGGDISLKDFAHLLFG